jgi:site-specific recombinase XerD
MKGASALAIQKLAGHADLTTTQRYMHLSPQVADEAIRLLDQPYPGKKLGEILEKGGGEPPKSSVCNS